MNANTGTYIAPRVRSSNTQIDTVFIRNAEGREITLKLQNSSVPLAYSGEREHSFRLNVNTFSLNALPTEVCTPGVHVQSIS
jgi:hypothetical protein